MKRQLTVLPTTLNLSGTDIDRLLGVLEIFNTVLPIAKVTLNLVSLPAVEPKVFLYKIEAVDGRLWKQHITFDNPSNPNMTFEVADPWRLSEFSNQRNVRNVCVSLVGAYPALEKVVYDYIVP